MRKFWSIMLMASLPCAFLSSCDKDDVQDPEEDDAYASVDLGLSVLWAECNVDADTPEEYGGYYAWGETVEKESYTEKDYTVVNEEGEFLIPDQISGTEYDVAHVKWGGDWRIPTFAECQELVNKCTWVRGSQNGVNGWTVTGPNGNSIFLPSAGYKLDGLNYETSNGSYWSGDRNVQSNGDAYYIVMGSRYRVDYSWACGGQSVRPVKTPKKK